MAHAIGHSDRKGRVERPFAYVENNFLAGRTFADWADLNAQARAWCSGGRQRQAEAGAGHEPAGRLRDGEGASATACPPISPR